MNNSKELTNTLYHVMNDRYFVYRTCRIREMIGGFEFDNKKYLNYIELDKAIDKTFASIANSINKNAPVETKGELNHTASPED